MKDSFIELINQKLHKTSEHETNISSLNCVQRLSYESVMK